MSELETLIDTPTEPEIKTPRKSFLSGEANHSKSHPDFYKDVSIVKLINQAKFPVYLAQCKQTRKKYAMKLFFSDEQIVQKFFKNETRFSMFVHPNIINIVYIGESKIITYKDNIPRQFSFILMDYAPYGDLHNMVSSYKELLTDKFVRTYFRQIIEGLEYLHSHNVAHLDIKLENLLIGEDYKVKITDFDLSYKIGDGKMLARGSKCCRAPELMNSKCTDPMAADIYSAGIVLFGMKTGGVAPHTEDVLWKGIDFFKLLNEDKEEFWKLHCEIQKKGPSFFSQDFRELFHGMTEFDPKKRMTISQIKDSEWYNGLIYTDDELTDLLNIFLKVK